jgi:hypothetical protein
MSVTQADFSQYSGIGFHGQQNTDYPAWISSQHAEGGAIGFGVAVSFGTADHQAVLGGASSGVLIGVTLRTQAVENNAAGESVYAEDKAMSVMEKGRLFVTVSDGATRGAPVYVVPATGELVSSADDGAATPVPYVALTGARFVRSCAAGEVSEIEIK